jgi:ion channel POLLUX/CASTOR
MRPGEQSVSDTVAKLGMKRKRRLRRQYAVERVLSRSGYTIALVAAGFIGVALTFGLVRAIAIWTFSPQIDPSAAGSDPISQFWTAWIEMTDPGTQAYDNQSSNWVKIFAVLAAVAGIVFLSALIAIMTNALDRLLRSLRSGKTHVAEDGHTLILGWNDRVLDLIRELIEANKIVGEATVVLLSERDKEELDTYLEVHLPSRFGTRIITRRGVPSDRADLELASPATASAIIVMRQDGGQPGTTQARRADIAVLKTIMTVLRTCGDTNTMPLIAELADDDHIEIGRGLAPGRVTVVSADDILAKIVVQCTRTAGLARVYRELLSFEGGELGFHTFRRSAPLRFDQIKWHLGEGVAVGLRNPHGFVFHPDPQREVEPGDEVLIFAKDRSSVRISEVPLVAATPTSLPKLGGERRTENALVIGWTGKSEHMVVEFAKYLAPGSRIHVVARNSVEETSAAVAAINERLPSIDVEFSDAEPSSLQGLGHLDLDQYDNIILLSQGGPDTRAADHTDTETLAILLRLRHLFAMRSANQTKLITEIMEAANDETIVEAGAQDVVISNKLISSLLARVSEDPSLWEVFEGLFAESGSEIYLKPAEWYFECVPAEATFAQIEAQVAGRGEIALGYRTCSLSTDVGANLGVVLNPPKTERVPLRPGDTIVVVAPDEL